jgi:hypothetical protein
MSIQNDMWAKPIRAAFKNILLLVFFVYFPFVQSASADLDPLSIWHEHPTIFEYKDVVYGNGVFVGLRSMGFPGGQEIVISNDGITWEGTGAALCTRSSLSYANGRFFVGDCSTVLISSDGRNWDRHPIPWESGQIFGRTAYGNGIYVAIGGSSPSAIISSGTVLTSTDGITWSRSHIGSPAELIDIAYGNGIFVAVGRTWREGYLHGVLLTSADGIIWTDRTPENTSQLRGIAFGGNIFVAVAIRSTWNILSDSEILISQDGINWSSEFQRGVILDSVVYGNGVFAARDHYHETLLTSPDGEHWMLRFNNKSGVTFSSSPVTFGNNTFLLFGENYLLQSDPFFGPGANADISVNMEDFRPSIKWGDPVSAEISLSPDVYIGTDADWWVVDGTMRRRLKKSNLHIKARSFIFPLLKCSP